MPLPTAAPLSMEREGMPDPGVRATPPADAIGAPPADLPADAIGAPPGER